MKKLLDIRPADGQCGNCQNAGYICISSGEESETLCVDCFTSCKNDLEREAVEYA